MIFLSFADIKEKSFSQARKRICQNIRRLYDKYDFLLDGNCLRDGEKELYHKISAEMEDYLAVDSLKYLSDYLSRYYGKKVLFLLDEYDTPMQESYTEGFWEEMVSFTRSLFNSTFKTNPYLERAIMTGITRVSKESVFSDLNNLTVVTTTSDAYADCFGFTEEEVWAALEEYGLSEKRDEVRSWYDGFTFGSRSDIYNPWSILNFLDKGIIKGLCITDDFSAGYLSVKAAIELAEGGAVQTGNYLDSYFIRRGDLRDEKYEKILYPVE